MDFKKISILLLFLTFSFNIAMAQELKIDLEKSTLNDKKICGFPLDNLTDLLGRPVSVNDNETVSSIIGPQLRYHNLGLEFVFKPKSKDSKQGIWMTTIYLSKTWDEEVNEFFVVFEDSLSPNLSANLKAENIEKIFKDNISSIRTAEEHKEMIKNIGLNHPDDGYNYVIKSSYKDHFHNLIHEDITKFLERVTIECKDQ